METTHKQRKPRELKSVKIQSQIFGDCWAHAASRNFVRTLQVLGVIKAKYNQDFYDLFYSVLVKEIGCYEGGDVHYLFILYDFLKSSYKDEIFLIKSNICEAFTEYCSAASEGYIFLEKMTIVDREQFIHDMEYLFNNNILFIGKYIYVVDPSGNNRPSRAIKTMLDFKLQPFVSFNLNKYLDNTIRFQNLSPEQQSVKPYVRDKDSYDNDCINKNDNVHVVNLRKWTSSYIEFKNSWDIISSDRGNLSVKDLKYLTCGEYNSVNFGSLMFRYDQIQNLEIKTKLDSMLSSYYQTFDPSLNIKKEDGPYDQYGFLNGEISISYDGNIYEGNFLNGFFHEEGAIRYADGDIYNGKWKEGLFHGKGIMIYADGRVYDGNWDNDNKNGQGTMIYPDGNVYQGEWKKDLRHGRGILTDSQHNIIYEGRWKNGRKINKYKTKYIKYKTKYFNLQNQLNQLKPIK